MTDAAAAGLDKRGPPRVAGHARVPSIPRNWEDGQNVAAGWKNRCLQNVLRQEVLVTCGRDNSTQGAAIGSTNDHARRRALRARRDAETLDHRAVGLDDRSIVTQGVESAKAFLELPYVTVAMESSP